MSKKIGIILAEKSIKIDPETFQPYMWLTVGVPLEAIQDGATADGAATVHEAIGKEISDLIKGQP